jgi:hypothetical protein
MKRPVKGMERVPYGPKTNGNTTRNLAICDDLLVTPLTFVIEWFVMCDEISIFVIGAK